MYRAKIDDDTIWRDCYRSEFWRKNVWVIPIHHPSPSPGHWTVAVVYVREQRIAYYDSFASKSLWEADAAVSAAALIASHTYPSPSSS